MKRAIRTYVNSYGGSELLIWTSAVCATVRMANKKRITTADECPMSDSSL